MEDGKIQKGGHPSHPILPGHEQPGPHQLFATGVVKVVIWGEIKRVRLAPMESGTEPLKFGRTVSKSAWTRWREKSLTNEKGELSKGTKENSTKAKVELNLKTLATTGVVVMDSANMREIIVSLTMGHNRAK
jgi:hypothetical protein